MTEIICLNFFILFSEFCQEFLRHPETYEPCLVAKLVQLIERNKMISKVVKTDESVSLLSQSVVFLYSFPYSGLLVLQEQDEWDSTAMHYLLRALYKWFKGCNCRSGLYIIGSACTKYVHVNTVSCMQNNNMSKPRQRIDCLRCNAVSLFWCSAITLPCVLKNYLHEIDHYKLIKRLSKIQQTFSLQC